MGKPNYLTPEELKMTAEEVNIQIVLGLQSCKTKGDVCELLNDVRLHERMIKTSEKFPIMTLCGSSKQRLDWEYYQKKFALEGNVVLVINIYLGLEDAGYNDDTATKRLLMEIHRQKIRMADVVVFIQKPDGTLGDHTTSEMEYAKQLGKKIQLVQSLQGRLPKHPNYKKTCPKCGKVGVSDGVFFCSCGYYEED